MLFRNNHFSTLFKFDDALYLLVTDQGYLHEQVCLQALSGSPWAFCFSVCLGNDCQNVVRAQQLHPVN